jgi:hypothetical protein
VGEHVDSLSPTIQQKHQERAVCEHFQKNQATLWEDVGKTVLNCAISFLQVRKAGTDKIGMIC